MLSKMRACPECGCTSVFAIPCIAVDLVTGEPHFGSGRVAAFCNNAACRERFTWFPRTKRIIRREGGPTKWEIERAAVAYRALRRQERKTAKAEAEVVLTA